MCESLILEVLRVVANLVVCCAVCFQLMPVATLVVCYVVCFQLRAVPAARVPAAQVLVVRVLVEFLGPGVESCHHLDVTGQFDTILPSTGNFDESAAVEQYGTSPWWNQCSSLKEQQEHHL